MYNILLLAAFTTIFLINIAVGTQIEHWPFLESFAQMNLQFGDLGVLLAMADFLIENPNRSPYVDFPISGYSPNYPLLPAQLLASLGIGIRDVMAVGLLSAALLWLALSLLMLGVLRRKSGLEKPFYFLLFLTLSFSPPIMLLLERGNYDIWIFLIVVMAALGSGRYPRLSVGLFGSAAVLKLFPIAAVWPFLSSRKSRIVAILVVVAFLGYLLGIRDQLEGVNTNTPRANWAAFGFLVIPSFVDQYVTNSMGLQIAINLGLHALGIACGLLVIRSLQGEFSILAKEIEASPTIQGMLLTGGSISVFSYLLGNSYDYRLVFIMIPLVAVVMTSTSGNFKTLLIAGTVFLFLWSFPANQISPVADFLIIPVLTLYAVLMFRVANGPESVSRVGKTLEGLLKSSRNKLDASG